MSSLLPGSDVRLVAASRPDLCLEFADTRYWRGTQPPTESLHGIEDVVAWCRSMGTLDEAADTALRAWWREHPQRAAAAFDEAVALRESIFTVFSDASAAHAPAPDALDRLNGALASAPARANLRIADGGYVWELPAPTPDAASLLAPVLWSAGDLLTGPRLGRVRRCANDKCLWLFLDESKSGTRRWCSMSACGNRAKAHRHYAKRKAEG